MPLLVAVEGGPALDGAVLHVVGDAEAVGVVGWSELSVSSAEGRLRRRAIRPRPALRREPTLLLPCELSCDFLLLGLGTVFPL